MKIIWFVILTIVCNVWIKGEWYAGQLEQTDCFKKRGLSFLWQVFCWGIRSLSHYRAWGTILFWLSTSLLHCSLCSYFCSHSPWHHGPICFQQQMYLGGKINHQHSLIIPCFQFGSSIFSMNKFRFPEFSKVLNHVQKLNFTHLCSKQHQEISISSSIDSISFIFLQSTTLVRFQRFLSILVQELYRRYMKTCNYIFLIFVEQSLDRGRSSLICPEVCRYHMHFTYILD